MKSLDEAWNWYQVTKSNLQLFARLARRHWDDLPWESLRYDGPFKAMSRVQIENGCNLSLRHLNDQAIIVLFSVFEAQVRDAVVAEVKMEASTLRHPALQAAGKEAIRGLDEGSFFRVLGPFKNPFTVDLIEQVDQVRHYRNWVAHGRRGDELSAVEPLVAYRRLKSLLELILPAS